MAGDIETVESLCFRISFVSTQALEGSGSADANGSTEGNWSLSFLSFVSMIDSMRSHKRKWI